MRLLAERERVARGSDIGQLTQDIGRVVEELRGELVNEVLATKAFQRVDRIEIDGCFRTMRGGEACAGASVICGATRGASAASATSVLMISSKRCGSIGFVAQASMPASLQRRLTSSVASAVSATIGT